MKDKHINGKLRLSYAAMKDTSIDQYEVQAAIEEHKLGLIMYIDKQWYNGIIPVKALYGTPESAGVDDILTSDVIKTCQVLKEFLQSDVISKLGLSGEIILKIEDTKADTASMAKIVVKDGEVSYQRANYAWSASITA